MGGKLRKLSHYLKDAERAAAPAAPRVGKEEFERKLAAARAAEIEKKEACR